VGDRPTTREHRTGQAISEPLALVARLKASPAVAHAAAGSHRPGQDTVGEVDILIASRQPSAVVARFAAHPRVSDGRAKGPTRSAVVLDSGLAVDLRVVPAMSYGSAPLYFTGSKSHNIAIRPLGVRRGRQRLLIFCTGPVRRRSTRSSRG